MSWVSTPGADTPTKTSAPRTASARLPFTPSRLVHVAISAFSGVEVVAMTVAPASFERWMIRRPTPPAPACTRTVSPCATGWQERVR